MNITIENKDYVLDVEAAIKSGALKKNFKKIKAGDVFLHRGKSCAVYLIVEGQFESEKRWCILGCEGLSPWNINVSKTGSYLTEQEVIDYLVQNECVYRNNISE